MSLLKEVFREGDSKKKKKSVCVGGGGEMGAVVTNKYCYSRGTAHKNPATLAPKDLMPSLDLLTQHQHTHTHTTHARTHTSTYT